MQFVAPVHETLDRPLELLLGRFGLGTIDHVEPFQRSMSVLPIEAPTAMHNVVLGHDTPISALVVAPGGFGLGTTVQPDAVGCSISVTVVPVVVWY